MRVRSFCLVVILFIELTMGFANAQKDGLPDAKLPRLGEQLTDAQVVAFATLALDGIPTEYPNKPSNVMAGAESIQSPKEMHPAFYGCFDWHSSVHGHWMLVRLLKEYPDNSLNQKIRDQLSESLTAENIQGEVAYYTEKQNKSFERMYGWAWLLRLVLELEQWDDPQGQEWRENLKPLEEIIVQRTMDYLPLLSFPIRTGVHPDSGFALGQALDYARVTGNQELETLIVQRARDFYLQDTEYPTRYEPSGQDFFSSGLNEADLMRRVLSKRKFQQWFDRFMPGLKEGAGGNLLVPVEVSDVTDGKIVHLAGLDLSRAWCFQGVASALEPGDPRRQLMLKSADEHAAMGFKYVFSGSYEGEHWLATFAIYLITRVGAE